MLRFHNNSADTRVEDPVFLKIMQAGCPLPVSEQGTGRLVHFGVTSAPGIYVLSALGLAAAEWHLLTEFLVPVARVHEAFVPVMLVGGLLGSALTNLGRGRCRALKTAVARLSKAEQDAERAKFPLYLRGLNWLGAGLLAGIAAVEGWMWVHGSSMLNLRRVTIPPTTMLGVLAAWAGLAVAHWRITGPALWVAGSGFQRWWHVWRQRRHEKLEDSPGFVHGWRQHELTLSRRATDASTQRHHLVFERMEDGQYRHLLFTFGNFDGNQAAEMLANQPEAVKPELAAALEAVLVNLLTQPCQSRDSAKTEEYVEACRRRQFQPPRIGSPPPDRLVPPPTPVSPFAPPPFSPPGPASGTFTH